jgi:hypothetical protein
MVASHAREVIQYDQRAARSRVAMKPRTAAVAVAVEGSPPVPIANQRRRSFPLIAGRSDLRQCWIGVVDGENVNALLKQPISHLAQKFSHG